MTTVRSSKTRRRHSAPKHQPLRVLVATAGDADSIGALWIASALARERSAEVMALGVSPPFPHSFPSVFTVKTPLAIDEGSRRRMLDDVRDVVREIPGAEQWNKTAMVGWPADSIAGIAASWNASLIVIGLGRHGRLDRLFGTETAIAVMKHAKVPVVAVSADARELPKHACVAVDFTPASFAAANVAALLVAKGGAVSMVHACAFEGANAQPGDLVDLYRTGAKAKLDRAVVGLRRRYPALDISGSMINGDPAGTIVAFAEERQCDLIALGGHEQSLIDRMLLGSVRTKVLRTAQCSVLIAPPSATDLKVWRDET